MTLEKETGSVNIAADLTKQRVVSVDPGDARPAAANFKVTPK
jgi:hypothetical protein